MKKFYFLLAICIGISSCSDPEVERKQLLNQKLKGKLDEQVLTLNFGSGSTPKRFLSTVEEMVGYIEQGASIDIYNNKGDQSALYLISMSPHALLHKAILEFSQEEIKSMDLNQKQQANILNASCSLYREDYAFKLINTGLKISSDVAKKRYRAYINGSCYKLAAEMIKLGADRIGINSPQIYKKIKNDNLISLLIEKDAISQFHKGRMMVHAIENDLPKTIRVLVDIGLDLNDRLHVAGDYGYAIQLAAKQGNLEIFTLLTDLGASLDNVTMFDAALAGNSEMIKHLMSVGVPINERLLDSPRLNDDIKRYLKRERRKQRAESKSFTQI